MRVTGKLVTGTGIAVALLLGVLVWDLATIRRLAAVAEDLSEVSFRASNLALEQDRLINRIDEFTRKHSVTGDEAARTIGVSPATADRYWTFARAWLYRELDADDHL